jgi:hypothetical protein
MIAYFLFVNLLLMPIVSAFGCEIFHAACQLTTMASSADDAEAHCFARSQ